MNVSLRQQIVSKRGTRPSPPYFVYVMACGDENVRLDGCKAFVKVGITTDAQRRLSILQTGSPLAIDLFWVSEPMSEAEARRIETGAHEAMQAVRVRGEWFATYPQIAVGVVKTVTQIDPKGWERRFEEWFTTINRQGPVYEYEEDIRGLKAEFSAMDDEWLEGYKRGPQPGDEITRTPPLPGDDE